MSIATDQQKGSPGWWLKRLKGQLDARRPTYDLMWRHYTDEADLPDEMSPNMRDAYRAFRRLARLNFAELIVEATRERMKPAGFRMGADDTEGGDKRAWSIWQANHLDADAALVHRSSLAMGDSYAIVGAPDDEVSGFPLITPEDPREVITAHDPARRRKVTAALKCWWDPDEGVEYAYVYLPGVAWRTPGELWIATRKRNRQSPSGIGIDGFSWAEDSPQQLPTSRVPVVRFANKADLAGCSKGEFETHIGALNRINYQVLQRLQIITLQAFRQRAVKGLPIEDEQGQKIDYRDIFRMDPAALWQLPETADMWESGQVDITPIQTAIKDDVQYLAAVTRTPMHYFSPDAANGSAEGASLHREGLVFKVQDRLDQAGETWESLMSLAFEADGDIERAKRPDMEVMWMPPDRSSLAERYDAAVKAINAGVPWRTVMTDVLGFSPQQVARMEIERMQESFTLAGREAIPYEQLPGQSPPPPGQAVLPISQSAATASAAGTPPAP